MLCYMPERVIASRWYMIQTYHMRSFPRPRGLTQCCDILTTCRKAVDCVHVHKVNGYRFNIHAFPTFVLQTCF